MNRWCLGFYGYGDVTWVDCDSLSGRGNCFKTMAANEKANETNTKLFRSKVRAGGYRSCREEILRGALLSFLSRK